MRKVPTVCLYCNYKESQKRWIQISWLEFIVGLLRQNKLGYLRGTGLIWVLGLIGCSALPFWEPQRVECAVIKEDLTFAQVQVLHSVDTVINQVNEEYGMTVEEKMGGWAGRAFYWERNGHEYAAVLAPSLKTLQRIEIRWNPSGPLGSDLLGCLGEPKFYRARVEQDIGALAVSFEFWYPSEGVVFSRSDFTGTDFSFSVAEFRDQNVIFTKATIVNSDDPEIMQDLAFDSPYVMVNSSPLETKKFSEFLKSWEGWENVEFDGYSRLLQE